MSNPEQMERVLTRLENNYKTPHHGNLRKSQPTDELAELLKYGPIRKINHVLQREERRRIPHKKVRLDNDSLDNVKKENEVVVTIKVSEEYFNAIKAILGHQGKQKEIQPTSQLLSDEYLQKRIEKRRGRIGEPKANEALMHILNSHCTVESDGKTSLNRNAPNLLIDSSGKITLDQQNFNILRNVLASDEDLRVDLHRLEAIFGENRIASASVISYLSSDNNTPDVSWLPTSKEKNYYKKIRKIVDSFDISIRELFLWKQKNDFINQLNISLKADPIDFTEINQRLCRILYKNFHSNNGSVTQQELKEFTSLPGIPQAVFALRKLFLASLTKEAISHSHKKDSYQNFSVSTSQDVWSGTGQLLKIYSTRGYLSDNSINPANFIGLSSQDIINQLAFFMLEKKIHNNGREFSERKIIDSTDRGSKKTEYEYVGLPILIPNQRHILTDKNGLKIPLSVQFNRDSQDFGFLQVYYNEYRISSIYIPIEKLKN